MKARGRFANLLVILISTVVLLGSPQRPVSHAATTTNPAWAAFVSNLDQMHGATMSVAPSGNSDVDFVKLMLPHHQAAIDMARTQLLYGKDPQMRRLAQEIITDQQSEIELMQLWLRQHPLQK